MSIKTFKTLTKGMKKRGESMSANPYFEVIDCLGIRAKRFSAAHAMSAGGRGSRQNRGKKLPPEKIEALIWGLSHDSPVVRRCCLELLDQPQDAAA